MISLSPQSKAYVAIHPVAFLSQIEREMSLN